MIPRIIHYCWFGRSPKPAEFHKMLNSWQKHLPDYEIKEWNEENFPIDKFTYSREAYEMGDYAFVADVARLYALYSEGGVYLDTDVEIIAPLDTYMRLESFIGRECDFVGTAVIGASKGMPWIKYFLDYYAKRHFINRFGHPQRTANTKILTFKILPKISYEERPVVFAEGYLSCKNHHNGELNIRPGAAAIHHFKASWRRHKNITTRLKTIIRGLRTRYCRGGMESECHS